MNPPARSSTWLTFGVVAVVLAAAAGATPTTLFAVLAATLLTVKLVASEGHSPPRLSGPGWRRVVVVTVFNEDEAALRRTLLCLAQQTWKPDAVALVDDASADPEVAQRARRYAEQLGLLCTLDRHATNQGKRQAIATAVRRHPAADAYLSVDSDTFLHRGAVEALCSRLGEDVYACTGMVTADNRTANLLTRLQDVVYTTAFSTTRAAQSRLGSVLVCSGAISAYRGTIVRQYLDDFVSQTWRGNPVVTGDDRRLTSYALRHGRVVYAPDAVGRTMVPELRQQVRWSRSWLRESWLTVAEQPLDRPQAWLAMLDVGVWVLFTTAFFVSVALTNWSDVAGLVGGYVLIGLILAPARAVRYLTVRTDLSLKQRVGGVALAPCYSLLFLATGVPIRLWATVTMGRSTWGSRARGVEVALPSEIPPSGMA